MEIWGDLWEEERRVEQSFIAVIDRKQHREARDQWMGRIAEPKLA
jgi:hypothetical protein